MNKICIYAICKNEKQFVQKWLDSMQEADVICVLDTGSTDGTFELLQEEAAKRRNQVEIIVEQKEIKPWRFDVARNESMKLIPDYVDFCICTDLDEILTAGWSNEFKRLLEENPNLEKIYYKYAWSHNEDGTPGRVFWYDKTHKNNGKWYWRHPVHEILTPSYDYANDKVFYADEKVIWLHHYPDQTKSRASYLPLLELRAEEDNNDDYYGLIYLAHEYFYRGMPQKCIDLILNKLIYRKDIDNICQADLFMFLGDSYCKLNNFKAAENWYKNGIDFAPNFRENYLRLANLCYELKRFEDCIKIVNKCLLKTTRLYSWLEKDTSWTYEPFDLLSLCYWELGLKEAALDYAYLAYQLDRDNKRLKGNYEFIKDAIYN